MLGKLLKYELKATARLFLPLYLTLIIFTVINRFLLFIPKGGENSFSFYGFLTAISMIIYVTLMIGLVAMTLIVMIQRFYKNLLGDEGYLMFTLPVKSWNHILSKLTISTLWTVASGIVAFFSILLISSKSISTPEFYRMFSIAFNSFIQYFGASSYLVSLETIVLGLLSIASTILAIYAAIALGHLFNKYKLLASFGMYIALQTGSQIIMSLSAAIFFKLDIFNPGTTFIPSVMLVTGILLLGILYYGVFCAGYFALTNYILKRKLNLE